METYPKTKLVSISSTQAPAHVEADGGAEALVNRCISPRKKNSRNRVESLLVWPRAVKLVREFQRPGELSPGDLRGEITGFSKASKRRLKFTASNSFPALVSQFGMTYHNSNPNGLMIKRHLDTFLKALSRKFPQARYLWILEFQTRKTPHFHLFLTLPHDTHFLHSWMAEKWNKIAEPESPQHLRFHKHARNFIPWDMGSGSYLCKYLDKEHQKAVPAGFIGVGRFWGNSRGLVPEPISIDTAGLDECYSWEQIDQETGECIEFKATEYVTRQLCRHHEKSLKKSPWRSSARCRPTSYTLPSAASIFHQLENYLYRQKRPLSEAPF